MVLKLIKYCVKLTGTTLLIGSLTYIYHQQIDEVVNDVRFYLNKEEPGFAKREQSFSLQFEREVNGKGNLETYLINYSQKLPVFLRNNGVMVGTPEYNYSSFRREERVKLCEKYDLEQKKEEKKIEKEDIIKRTLKRIYETIKF